MLGNLTIESAEQTGRRAGLARHEHDEARYRAIAEWFARAAWPHKNRTELKAAFDKGYETELAERK